MNAMSVQIHFSTINGGVYISGGSGPFGGPFEVTWNTLEDNVINGSVWMTGYNGFWEGFFRNNVHGSVNYNDNTLIDPDGNEVQSNTIHGNLNCSGNDPAPQQGDSEGLSERRHRSKDRAVHRRLRGPSGGSATGRWRGRPPCQFSARERKPEQEETLIFPRACEFFSRRAGEVAAVFVLT